jgi:hypothetical protein
MLKRNWSGLGPIRSDEGFSVWYGHKTLYYKDERGEFEIGYEDEFLFPQSQIWIGPNGVLSEAERAVILDRMLKALEWDGHHAEIWKRPPSVES